MTRIGLMVQLTWWPRSLWTNYTVSLDFTHISLRNWTHYYITFPITTYPSNGAMIKHQGHHQNSFFYYTQATGLVWLLPEFNFDFQCDRVSGYVMELRACKWPRLVFWGGKTVFRFKNRKKSKIFHDLSFPEEQILYDVCWTVHHCDNWRIETNLMPLDILLYSLLAHRSGTVVKVLCYKLEGRWFVPSWCHWNFSLT